jgi:exosortase
VSELIASPATTSQLRRLAEQDAPPPPHAQSLPWGKIALLALLVAGIFWSSLMRLWAKTNPFTGEGNWGHSFIVPLIGLYYLYLNREDIYRTPVKALLPGRPTGFQLVSSIGLLAFGLAAWFVLPGFAGSVGPYVIVLGKGATALGALCLILNWGVGSLVFGLLTFAFGIYPGQNDFVKDLGLVITIFGIVLTMCGWGMMKIVWFPIAFLVCALPWPPLVYSWVASPLQVLAANVAVFTLNITGVMAKAQGTKIVIPTANPLDPRVLNVAEACAGLRSLMTFITVGAAVAFLSSRPLWQKIFITAMAVPIAILCNVMRVAGQGLLDTYVSHELAEGFAHQFVGLVMLIPAFFMLLGLGWLVDQIFVEEADEKTPTKKKKAEAEQILRRPAPGLPRIQQEGNS